ncbi:MAG: hypothetical protein HQM16_17545 [Deltaproteobacteria bacterium]|nr:hypothetical protein [Deltaproteobacteria bacterium]
MDLAANLACGSTTQRPEVELQTWKVSAGILFKSVRVSWTLMAQGRSDEGNVPVFEKRTTPPGGGDG